MSSHRIIPDDEGRDSRQVQGGDAMFRWQWHNEKQKQEWNDYSDDDNTIIEKAFQRGKTHLRVHSGKESSAKGHLKELFFGDMVQYNPISGKTRAIRRLGPDSVLKKVMRCILGQFDQIESGSARHKSFLKYKKVMEKVQARRSHTTKEKPVRSEFCAQISKGGIFVMMQMVAIILNTIVIGFDVEYNGSDASSTTRSVFQGLDNAFCIFFTVEILIRFGAMKKRATAKKAFRKTLADRWFVFDLILVLLMVIETWLMPLFYLTLGENSSDDGLSSLSTLRLLRLMRLTRVGRVARLLKFFPETFMMVKSIFAAMRAVLTTLGILLGMMYIFAIIFKTRCEGTPIQVLFPTIPGSMWQLLLNGAFMDSLGDTMQAISEEDMTLFFLFLMFVFLSNLTVLNMLIGVICEVANDVSAREKEMRSAKSLKEDLMEFLECFDMDDDHLINIEEFELLIGNPDVRYMLQRHEVDVDTVVSLKKSLFIDKEAMSVARIQAPQGEDVPAITKDLTFDELIDTILRFRGGSGSHATILDVMNLDRSLSSQMWRLEKAHSTTIFRKSATKALHSARAVCTSSPDKVGASASPLPPPKSELKEEGTVEGDPQPENEPQASSTLSTSPKIEIAPVISEDDPFAQLKADLAAEIHEQLRQMAVEIKTTMSSHTFTGSKNQEKDHDARGKYSPPSKQLQAVPQDAATSRKPQGSADADKGPPGGTGTSLSADDEWGSTHMHLGSYARPTGSAVEKKAERTVVPQSSESPRPSCPNSTPPPPKADVPEVVASAAETKVEAESPQDLS